VTVYEIASLYCAESDLVFCSPAIGCRSITGLSFTAVTFTLTVAVDVFGSGAPLVVPLSATVYVKLAGPL
jgi:hypothetical protein